MPALPIGAIAPDFSLAAHSGATVSLASYRGKPAVVCFLPFAFTGG
jgi:peroxiredoxin